MHSSVFLENIYEPSTCFNGIFKMEVKVGVVTLLGY